MFCARCGKEIDDDSTFCPFCGQNTNEPVESGGGGKSKESVKMPGKKVIGGIAVVAVVLLVVFGISKVIGGISNRNKPLSEKLFAMSWEEISEISEDDFKEMLDEAGTLYSKETEEDLTTIKTKTTEPFMGGDCLYSYAPESFATAYGVKYETEENFKAGREQIEEALEKSLLKNAVAFESTYDGVKMKLYPIGVSDKKLDGNLDTVENVLSFYGIDNVNELDDEELVELSQQSMYKFAFVIFGTQNDMSEITDEFVFPSDKSYTNYMCAMVTLYMPMSEEELISSLAINGGHDAVTGKKIDIDKFKESVDEELVNGYLDEEAGFDNEEYRRELEEKLYIRLYMMEKHKFDTELNTYLKTDDEKRLWYVRNFNWDTNTDAPIDLSGYRDSGAIYCAAECNYNSDTAEYFESKLDRALYLADRDYKADTGESFGGTDEKRLWFMQNYSYDTSSGKAIDKEVVDALIAYQKYVDEDDEEFKNRDYGGYNLIFIDEDEVPELLATGSSEAAGHKIISYHNETMKENYIGRLGGIRYAEKNNFYCNSNGNTGSYYDEFYKLVEGEQTEIALGESREKYDEEGNLVFDESGDLAMEYFWNGAECSSKEEYDNTINDFIRSTIGETEFQSGYFREHYFNILEAYDALRTTIYETYEYCIYEYELKDGILTVKADDGANADTNSFGTCQPFEFSCPVADNCVWQEGGHGYGDEAMDGSWDVAPEDIENEIRQERKIYDTAPDELQSPPGIQFRIIDDEVVAVYTSKA